MTADRPQRPATPRFRRGSKRPTGGRSVDPVRARESLTDAAERLEAATKTSNLTAPLKTFVYDGASGAGLGKLYTASSFVDVASPPGSFEVEIRGTYSYSGRQGRVSHRTTEATLTPMVLTPLVQETWNQGFVWTNLGQLASADYPACIGGGCDASLGSAPTIAFNYDNGLLSAVPGYALSIGYHPNLMTSEVVRANGVTDHIAIASNGMTRPASIGVTGTASDPLPAFDYQYDGSGNVKSINSDSYKYDRVNRLVAANHGPGWLQNVTFDTYGNIQSIETHDQGTVPTPTNATTNRLSGAAQYDASGNLTSWNLQSYQYDLLNRMTRVDTGSEEWVFAYTADDERIWAVRADGGRSVWTLRGLDGKVLRRAEFFAGNGACGAAAPWGSAGSEWPEAGTSTIFADDFEGGDLCAWSLVIPDQAHWDVNDYVWRGTNLLAVNTPGGDTQHFHLDHLGTPRLITGTLFDGPAEVVAYHAYQPFGEEVTDPGQDQEVMKFTGHERNLRSTPTETADDLDYMHARACSPLTGRFLSVDPVLSLKRAMKRPQAWNRYAYVVGNPLKYVDPTGEVFKLAGCGEGGNADQCNAQKAFLANTLGASANQIRVNADGTVSLAKGVSGAKFAAGGDFQKGLLKLIGDKSTFSLVTGTGRGAEQGGGEFVADKAGGGTIYLEPGIFPKMTGDVMGTAQTALVHETAHALGTLFPDFYRRMNAALGRNFKTMLTEGYAVNFENRYRRAIGADIRGSYGGEYNDVVLDFDVDLFP